jgi:hypothetical protein
MRRPSLDPTTAPKANETALKAAKVSGGWARIWTPIVFGKLRTKRTIPGPEVLA